ncbi:MAG: DUF3999 family protein [Acidobacteriota bacterium]
MSYRRRAVDYWLLLAFVSLCIQGAWAQQHASYFRDVSIPAAVQQSYITVDEEIWTRARPDLGDLRLYDGSREAPYALVSQRAATSVDETEARVLQLGSSQGRTEFVLDLGAAIEYDRITLRLKSRNFVARAVVEGQDEMTSGPRTRLGEYTVYDFSGEKLGSNSTIKLPPSRFRYLRVSIDRAVAPGDVTGATVARVEEKKMAWTAWSTEVRVKTEGRTTVAAWTAQPGVPLEGLLVDVAPDEINFLREIEVRDGKGRVISAGRISRLQVRRRNHQVDSEHLSLDVPRERSASSKSFSLLIHNGDNLPLRIVRVTPVWVERRVYFDVQGKSRLRLYYGDDRLSAPDYDYAKFFEEDRQAQPARLGAGERNPEYTARPDTRPWSDRHPWFLWSALILAIVVLAGLALRGLRN